LQVNYVLQLCLIVACTARCGIIGFPLEKEKKKKKVSVETCVCNISILFGTL
jgi:hypothetical protein